VGFLRLYLALCVVAAHAKISQSGAYLLDSSQAVQMFFIISGFYMALIWKGRYHCLRAFYISRGLRIFVPYFCMLFLVLVVSAGSGLWGGHWLSLEVFREHPLERNDFLAVVFATATNFTVFGQDILHFLNGAKGTFLRFSFSEGGDGIPLWRFAMIPQAWTVSLELCFYLLVPLLLGFRGRWLWGILALSVFLRFLAYVFLGLDRDPWATRFFPFEIALFAAGLLAFRFYRNVLVPRLTHPSLPKVSYPFFLLGLCLLLLAVHFTVSWASGLMPRGFAVFLNYATFPLWIGLAFHLTKNNTLDRAIGELSFPVYLNHFLIIDLFDAYGISQLFPLSWRGEIMMASSIVLALIMYLFLLKPFETWRHKFVGVSS
jgi:peptidoglycan/LPS O-acetylase OafA/YrhL